MITKKTLLDILIVIFAITSIAGFTYYYSKQKSNQEYPLVETNSEMMTYLGGDEKSTEEVLLLMEEQIEIATKSGGMRPENYDYLIHKLNELESRGADKEKITSLRAKMELIGVGGREKQAAKDEPKITDAEENKKDLLSIENQLNIAKQSGGISAQAYAELMDQLSDLENKGVDTTSARKMAVQIKIGGQLNSPGCVSNSKPIFTHHVTDVEKIKYVAPPPTMGAGPDLKVHSYIGTNSVRVPVYAPVDMVFDSGAYFETGPYGLEFEVSCEIRLRIGHMTDPIQSIKDSLPSVPAKGSDSRGVTLKYTIPFKAGDLIGYVERGNFDFGVYDISQKNRYAGDPKWGKSWVWTSGVCPYDYFPQEMRSAYASKFNTKILEGNPPHGESFCKF